MENKESVCDIVQDLLPLYHDGVVSDNSRKFVEEHLAGCEKCQNTLKMLDDEETETELYNEAGSVLSEHYKKEQRLGLRIGVIFAGIFLLPVLIALFLTIPGYSDLKTDAVLAASMLLVTCMIVVPLISKTKKFVRVFISSVLALLLVVFLVEMLYDGGNIIAFIKTAVSTIFGLSFFFAPVVVRQIDLIPSLKNKKVLLVISWDTLWFYLMLVGDLIGYKNKSEALGNGTAFVVLVWVIFLLTRYLRVNPLIKTGLIISATGIWAAVGNAAGYVTISVKEGSFLDIHTQILAVSLSIGAIFIVIGAVKSMKR